MGSCKMGVETFWHELRGIKEAFNSEERQLKLLADTKVLVSFFVGVLLVITRLALSLSSGSSRSLVSSSTVDKLENHPMCGITTNGKEECFFDCFVVPANITITGYQYHVVTDPACLQDCFSKDPGSPSYCMHSLLEDVLSKGMCITDTYLNYT